MSRSDLLNSSRWLEAHLDRGAGLNTLPRNIVLSDVCGDGDHRLVLTDLKLYDDMKSRLKMYKGTVLAANQILPDIPAGVISFYVDSFEPKIPVIGVACGSDFLIYKNMKPYFKFTLPSLSINAVEKEVWQMINDKTCQEYHSLIDSLKSVSFNELSARSQTLLSLRPDEVDEYINKYMNIELNKQTTITCLATLKKSSLDSHSAACPVIGTEAGQIFILDPQSYNIIHQAIVCNTKAIPYIIDSSGLFDVEYKLIIACREGYVTLLRRNWLEGKILFQTTNNIVDMIYLSSENLIVIATTDSSLECYNKKGNKMWSISTPNKIMCLSLILLKHLNTSLFAVGLSGGNIILYKGRQKIDNIQTAETPSAIVFGQMGQEDHVMIIISLNGTINFKILKRTADFNLSKQDSDSTPILQSKPLPIPKRSKLFLEQTVRERQNAIDIHQNFQQDLFRLRLTTARTLVQMQVDKPDIGNEKELIKLSAQILGLGPKFTLILTLENINNEKPLIGLSVQFNCKPTLYDLSTYLCMVPLIPPGLSFKIENKVTEVNCEEKPNKMEGDITSLKIIRVFVTRKSQAQPVLAATINMPPTDLSIPFL